MRSGLNNYIFKLSFVLVVFSFLIATVNAQEKRKKILPHHVKVQYAGGIGFISVGAGYNTKNEKLEADLFYGYLPKSIGGVRIHSLSGKFSWIPHHLSIKNKYRLEPLIAGLLINYNFGKQFFGFDPQNYSYKYYSFPTAINTAIFIGSRIDLNKPGGLSLYYELLGFDRDILNLVNNPKSLNLSDVITLSLGARIKIK